MQLRYLKNLQPSIDGMQKVTAIAWSLNHQRLAVASVDKIVHLYDEFGEKQDRFSTKPAEKENRVYVVKSIEFSPDSTKLAVGQSDNIIFVYKLGTEWKDKKSICNKFPQASSVTCMCWPAKHPQDLVFGLAEGRVKVGQIKSNRTATLYQTDSFVVSVCEGPDGNSILSGHLDGSIYRFSFETDNSAPIQQKFCKIQGCCITALAWGVRVVAAGNDQMVRFFTNEGREHQSIDYTNRGVKEFTCARFNPSGESCVLGNFNKFFVYSWHARNKEWQEVCAKEICNMYTITAMCWRPDGSRLVIGSLCGSVDMFDACLRRARYKGQFEFTYIALSQVIVKNLTSGARIVLKSTVGFEITKINIYQQRYLVAHTVESLMLGDMHTCRLSEIPWHHTVAKDEKFNFDNPDVAMIFKSGEMSLVEYGQNEILGCARTEHTSAHLISVRIFTLNDIDVRIIAHLLDVQTIRVSDLTTGQTLAIVTYDTKIDWLELNGQATKLLFRDKRRQLHLYDIQTQTRVTLLNYCKYVQWVPDSDVVVAQNRGQLCVWYSINAPDRCNLHDIKGDVEEIERTTGRTIVIVDEGVNTVEYELDEALINFGSCLERKQYAKAVDILEELPLTPETEAMWRSLVEVCMEDLNALPVAERCYAVLGDVSKSRFLHKVNKLVMAAQGGPMPPIIEAKLAMLQKQFGRAEAIMLDCGDLEGAMQMYQELHKYDESIRLAEKKNHPNVQHLKESYLQWLLSTQQEEKAGELQEREGNFQKAIELYLRGGMAAKAAALVSRHNANYSQELLLKIAASLATCGMHDRAGELFERMGLVQQAMDAYKKGHGYRQAVDLAKHAQPGAVVQLEEMWGDWLVAQKQVDAAINHYIEAGCSLKAIDATIAARQWHKAEQLLETTTNDPNVALPYYEKLGQHYANSRQLEAAERSFIKAGKPQSAVQMYIEHAQYDKAHRLAKQVMSIAERCDLYVSLAQKLEKQSKYTEAEQLYVMVNEYDQAIHMYKKREDYEQMLRLVSKHRKELLTETYKHIAEQYEVKGNLKKAEHYFVEAGMWTQAMAMYRQLDKWDEAQRVAKIHGGKAAFEKVVMAQARETFQDSGVEAGTQFLAKHGLTEKAIDYALEHGNFVHAFELAQRSCPQKVPEIHYKKAIANEDNGQFKLAEEDFVKANKPREAVEMYIHQQDWTNALRVAGEYDPTHVPEVRIQQAKDCIENKNYSAAEQLFILANKANLAVQMYSSRRQMSDAIRVCKKHCPHMLSEVADSYGEGDKNYEKGAGAVAPMDGSLEDILDSARVYEETGAYSRAIDAYLSVNDTMTSNEDQLEEIWENAVRLAMRHVVERYPEVLTQVAQRLSHISRYEAAAELYESVDGCQREAINCYISAQAWDKAKTVARMQQPDMLATVEARYRQSLVASGDGEELVRSGDVSAALDMYARQGDWATCLNLAEQQAPNLLGHYVIQAAKIQSQHQEVEEACQLLVRYGPPKDAANFSLYKLICHELVQEAKVERYNLVLQFLRKLVSAPGDLYPIPPGPRAQDAVFAKEFFPNLLVAHYLCLREQLKMKQGFTSIIARVSVAILRYCTELPVDRAFYEAGFECKQAGMLSMAFFFLNRYLDIVDAIEDQQEIDNTDFLDTDIPSPYETELPEKQCLELDRIEEIRDWVLGWSVDAKVEQKMETRQCIKCSHSIYIASLRCSHCQVNYDPCVITGYPVSRVDRVECTNCHVVANRDDWNVYLGQFKACPWCSVSQNPLY
eukprot:GEMP01000873.1.p1 GENE.GEMP01000873.1~~GEMP01000873.1.p1  ORF type:complete len:1750 (+),score=429.25 GEMP01000873.1:263-5512(+)